MSPFPYIVLDFEAAPLKTGGFVPIEIGLCLPGQNYQSFLIKPHEGWNIDNDRLMNPLLFEDASLNGKSIVSIVEMIVEIISGKTIVSDALFFDKPLLELMFSACSISLKNRMKEFFVLIYQLAAMANVDRSELNKMINSIDLKRGPSHRAGPDAWVRAELLAEITNRLR